MQVITAPRVHLLSRPMFFPHPQYEVPPHHNEAERLIATAGKVCYDSYGADGRAVEAHVRGLVASAHLSVLEHVHVGVFIEGISRGCSHEIVRHRMFNYSQRSTRYTREEDAAIVLDPYYASLYDPSHPLEVQPYAVELFLKQCQAALRAYRQQIVMLEADVAQVVPHADGSAERRKWCRGKARQLLPHALETRLVMTGNLRAWRHFILMRSSRHAEGEIRRLTQAIADVVCPVAPHAFAGLREESVDGFQEFTETSHG